MSLNKQFRNWLIDLFKYLFRFFNLISNFNIMMTAFFKYLKCEDTYERYSKSTKESRYSKTRF
jgi:hypothetical protein